MKKRLIAVISLIISLFVCVGVLTGCDLVTTNTERDMNQTVATVNIGGDYKGKSEDIKKKDMIIAYMQYGYYYAQQGQYSNSQLFGTIIDNLINERIIVQTAKVEVAKANSLNIEDWMQAKNFISKEDEIEARYNAVLNMKSLIDGYKEKEETFGDTTDVEARAVPTGATNYAEKFSDIEDKEKAITELKDNLKGETGSEQMIAYNKVIKLLEVNELLGDIKDNDILTSYYYEYMLEAQYEAKLIGEYEQLLLENKIDTDEDAKTNFNNLTYEALKAVFTDLYDGQKKLYEKDIQAYKTALGSATKTAPIVYASSEAKENVGYVWNLLIGATAEQTEKIGKIDKSNKSNEKIEEEREDILEKDIVMKDQRSSWVTSGYDAKFDNDLNTKGEGTLQFINGYTYLGASGLKFQGKVKWLNKTVKGVEYFQEAEDGKEVKYYYVENDKNVYDDEYKAELAVISVDEVIGKDAIISEIQGYITDLGATNDTYNEILMAFSTDPGSLNSFNGYVILNGDEKSSWVKEFQKCGEELIGKDKKDVVATDYGYHFMVDNGLVKDFATLEAYCGEVDGSEKSGQEYFDYLMKNWNNLTDEDKDTYLYYLANTYMQNIVTNYETEVQRITLNDSDKVTKFESRYKDLIEG